MKAVFHSSFLRDIKKLRDRRVQSAVEKAIDSVERANSIDQINSIKRLSGHSHYYRIRIGDWRIGLKIEAETAIFVRCLHRREMYRYFP
jgi:mRNA interferase RelE/StbE